MKKVMSLLCAMAICLGAAAQGLIAFPGAEGFGKYTTGGRGGTIYHVTNLNDSGPGSLRDAVSGTNRIIVFDVSGVINLKSALVFKGNNTVLGQTAPGEGIQVYGDRVSFSGASNLIVRYIRFRMGASGTSGADACGVANGENMIFDHLSVLWGRDENFSVSWDNKGIKPANITIQNSIIGQGLQSHSCGGLIQTDGGVTIYRNLYIENKTRNVKAKGLNQYVNNLVYNWGDGGCYIESDSEGSSWAHLQGNYFMRGPWNGATQPFTRGIQTFHFFGADNVYDDNKNGVLDGYQMSVDEMIGKNSGTAPYSTYFDSFDAINADIDAHNATLADDAVKIKNFYPIEGMIPADEVYAWMIENVGPVLPVRDEVDQYLIDEILTYGTGGTKNGISSEIQLPHKGTGVLSGGVKPLDSDGDAIPDEWEIANGLNPNDPADATAIAENGYANIENYANSIVEAYPYIKKPIKLAIVKQAKESLDIKWDINKNDKHGFEIELSTNGTDYAVAATADTGTSEYHIEGLTPDTKYWIRLRATDGAGLYSDYTDVLETETINDPSAPKVSYQPFPAVGAKEGIASGLTLTWANDTKAYDGTVLYTVLMGESAETLAPVATDLTATSYKTTDLVAGKTYYWRVDARNDIGSTEGEVWYFSTTAGGVLFYTDFYKQPQAWFDKYGSIADNTNIINGKNTEVTIAGMKIGSGDNTIRVVAMSANNNSDDLNADYGPATEDDRGASNRCIQFVTTAAGGYITFPEVQGPCVLTLYLGNPDKSAKTVKLNTIVGDNVSTQDLVLGAKKRVYKHEITYTNAGPVTFQIDANAKKFNINDVLIERWVPAEGDTPLEVTSGALVNDITYADGAISVGFNQGIKYNGGAVLSGNTQYENVGVTASGTKLNISYEALNVNTTYTLAFAEGMLTNLEGDKSFVGNIVLNTGDFPALKASTDNHYGKAAKTLPLTFRPFSTVAPFETVGGLVQSAQNDYPHWVQVSTTAELPGEITEDHVVMTTKNDKVMCYFDPQPKNLYLDLDHRGEGDIVLKVQESRNCDIAPGWRTLRVFHASDLPFKGELPLNPESHFVKVSVPSISGEVILSALQISDVTGAYAEEIGGIATTVAGKVKISTNGCSIVVTGASAGVPVSVSDISGRVVALARANSDGFAEISLPAGIYIVKVSGKIVKISI